MCNALTTAAKEDQDAHTQHQILAEHMTIKDNAIVKKCYESEAKKVAYFRLLDKQFLFNLFSFFVIFVFEIERKSNSVQHT